MLNADRSLWALPNSVHDRRIRLARIVLPVAVGIVAASLVFIPLTKRSEISFILKKDKVELATERMRITNASYRGEDQKGQPFSLQAGSAVQRTSKIPIVELLDLSARVVLDDGPAMLRAPRAAYDMETEKVQVVGPLLFQSAQGYRLATRDVGLDLKSRTLAGDHRVEGRMPLGTFSGDRLRADLNQRSVTLQGHARLHIVQSASRGR